MTLLDFGDALLYVAALGSLTAVLLYTGLEWWRSWVGRSLMLQMVAVAVITVVVSVRNIVGYFPAYEALRALAFGAVGASAWFQVIVLYQIRWLTRKK